jgi:murein DD-endopeptidase MepM/ murein hydrolase activator NlpD
MDEKPLHEFPPENGGAAGGSPSQRPNPFVRWIETLAHQGLGETTLRIGTNVLAVLMVVAVVGLMQFLYRQAGPGWTPPQSTQNTPSPTPGLDAASLPVEISFSTDGIARQALPHTIVPSRPREDVITYTVQPGDTVFGIADKFGLKPSTILFANFSALSNDVDLLEPGQVLNILPVDGVYVQYEAGPLTGYASQYNADAQAIIDSPANHLDPDALGDPSHPNIASGTWLVIPGGSILFRWNAPIVSRSGAPVSARVTGLGFCGPVTGGLVGFGTFIFPTTEHWLSGTDYRPDVGHYGVDFAGSLGNAVYAVDAGVIVYAGWNDWGYGNLIIVDHGNGWQSLYGHLSQINVQCDQSVGQGDVIGLVGSTGHSTGPHLHFELSYNGAHVNPHTVYDIPSP